MAILCYVLYYTLRIGFEFLAEEFTEHSYVRSPVNPVLATLSMVSLRLYSTMDNPYTTAILFLVGTR